MAPVNSSLRIFHRSTLLLTAITITYIAGLGVFAYFAGVVENFPGEVAASSWVQSYQTPWVDSLMVAFSLLGTTVVGVVILLAVCALLYFRGWRIEGIVVLSASVVGQVVTFALKQIVARPRPSPDVVRVFQEADSFSFPSNHVMIYTVFLGTIMVILFMKVRHTVPAMILQAAFVMFLLFTGYSRIYLGLHWLGDVVGGYAFGIPIIACAAIVWSRLSRNIPE